MLAERFEVKICICGKDGGGKKKIQRALRAGPAAGGESGGAGVLSRERLRSVDLAEGV